MGTTYTKCFDQIMSSILVDCFIQLPNSCQTTDEKLSALWDTGANITCISTRLANKLKLQASDEVIIAVANNKQFRADIFYVQLRMGDFTIPLIWVLGIPMDESKDVIAGMDVITKGDLAITNYNGKTVLSFREPSKESIVFSDSQ